MGGGWVWLQTPWDRNKDMWNLSSQNLKSSLGLKKRTQCSVPICCLNRRTIHLFSPMPSLLSPPKPLKIYQKSLEHCSRLVQQTWVWDPTLFLEFAWWLSGKEFACNAGDSDLIPGSEDPLEKGMATRSSVLAWRISWTEEPGGLQSMGSQKS